MGFGDALQKAIENATEAGLEAAENIAEGTKKIAVGAAKKAKEGYEYGKEKAIEAYDWSKEKAHQAKNLAKEGSRKVTSAIGRGGIKVVKTGKQVSEKTSKNISDIYSKAKQLFGDDKVVSRSGCQSTKSIDMKRDGRFLGWKDGKCRIIKSHKQKVDLSQSEKCKQLRKNSKKVKTIVYVNGIQNTKEDHCQTLKKIMETSCAKVVGIYNATSGKNLPGYIGDATQTEEERDLIQAADKGHPPNVHDGRNPAVSSLSDMIIASRKEKNVEIWAHSQGGAITSLALYDAKSALEMSGIKNPLKNMNVKSFGSAAPKWPDGPNYEHYVHVNDYTPLTYGLGDSSKKDTDNAGKNAKVIRFSGDPETGEFKKFKGDSDDKSWIGAPSKNHNMVDTYIKSYEQFH